MMDTLFDENRMEYGVEFIDYVNISVVCFLFF
jgi:hypothetical protein